MIYKNLLQIGLAFFVFITCCFVESAHAKKRKPSTISKGDLLYHQAIQKLAQLECPTMENTQEYDAFLKVFQRKGGWKLFQQNVITESKHSVDFQKDNSPPQQVKCLHVEYFILTNKKAKQQIHGLFCSGYPLFYCSEKTPL